MSKDVGMVIRVVSIPCLVDFLGFHHYMFLKCFCC